MQWDGRGTNKSKGNEIKEFESFDVIFFIHSNKQNTGVLGWPLKLLNGTRSKVRLTRSLPLCPKGRIFLPLIRHLSFSCGNPARLRPAEDTGQGTKLTVYLKLFFHGFDIHQGGCILVDVQCSICSLHIFSFSLWHMTVMAFQNGVLCFCTLVKLKTVYSKLYCIEKETENFIN